MENNQLELENQLFNMMWGYCVSGALRTAAELDIADHLMENSRTADELAPVIGCHAHSLYRLMRALATVGIFKQEGDKFSLTPLGNLLRSDIPRSQRDLTIEMCRYFEEWGQLTQTIKTGTPPKENIYHELLVTDEQAQSFYNGMDSFYYGNPAPMLGHYDFSEVETVADIGGASGSQLIAVLKHYPHLKGILFDLPDTAKRAQANIEAAGLADRCRAVGGSFFESVPGGADVYLIRHVIHNWNDEKSIQILSNIRKVLPAHGKVLIIETLVPSVHEKCTTAWHKLSLADKSIGSWWDLSMFVVDDGAERTQEEYAQLLTKAGLKQSRVIPTNIDVSLIEGTH